MTTDRWPLTTVYVARRRAAKRKMKQMKSHSSKDADEFEEETEDMFSEFGQFQLLFQFHFQFVCFVLSAECNDSADVDDTGIEPFWFAVVFSFMPYLLSK